jgi:hypothetical protein
LAKKANLVAVLVGKHCAKALSYGKHSFFGFLYWLGWFALAKLQTNRASHMIGYVNNWLVQLNWQTILCKNAELVGLFEYSRTPQVRRAMFRQVEQHVFGQHRVPKRPAKASA